MYDSRFSMFLGEFDVIAALLVLRSKYTILHIHK